jgi:hypothetical protein
MASTRNGLSSAVWECEDVTGRVRPRKRTETPVAGQVKLRVDRGFMKRGGRGVLGGEHAEHRS